MEPINLSDFEPLARLKLPLDIYDYFASGAEDEVTVEENVTAFRRIKLRPRMLRDVRERDLSTTVLGTKIAFPVILGPTSHQSMAHPDAEKATARAAEAMGTIVTLGTGNHFNVGEVAAVAHGPRWYQMYAWQNRETTAPMIRRGERGGCTALVVTVDGGYSPRRERNLRNNFTLPPHVRLGNMMEAGLNDAWLDGTPEGMDRFLKSLVTVPLTWDDIGWIRSLTSMKIVLKGIMTAEDAALAAEHGVDAIIVSNHGGRQLDGSLPSIEALPEVVAAVGNRLEVYLDGGIRRGADVVKALALGARAVLIARPYIWGLTVGGEAGVRAVLTLLRNEIDSVMAHCGMKDIASIDRSLVTFRA